MPQRAGQCRNRCGFLSGFGPQPVIDRQHQQPSVPGPCPSVGQMQQSGTVGPARNRHGHQRVFAENGIEKGRTLVIRDRLRRDALGQGSRQPAAQFRAFVSLISRRLMFVGAFGKSSFSLAKVVHASSLRSIRARDIPSFNRLSAAFGLSG